MENNKTADDILSTCTSAYSIRQIDRTTQQFHQKILRDILNDRKFRNALCMDHKRAESGYPLEFNVKPWAYKLSDVLQCHSQIYSLTLRNYFHDYCSKFVIEMSDEYDCRPITEYFRSISFPVLSKIANDISGQNTHNNITYN